MPGSTSLGPSLAIVQDLKTTGRAAYSVMNFVRLSTSSGTLTRVGTTSVPFSVLLNGQRTTLPALRVTGLLKYGDKTRPWEQYIFDDSKHPVTLRLAYGAVGEATMSTPEFTREVVRIDFPVAGDQEVERSLTTQCRVEVPGIYFDFDRATLKPESGRALTTIADAMRRHPEWSLRIEGHTDNVGGDAYNQSLSTRRAAAVQAALVSDFRIAPGATDLSRFRRAPAGGDQRDHRRPGAEPARGAGAALPRQVVTTSGPRRQLLEGTFAAATFFVMSASAFCSALPSGDSRNAP